MLRSHEEKRPAEAGLGRRQSMAAKMAEASECSLAKSRKA